MSHEGAVVECDRIQSEHKLIHEHHFVPRRVKGADHFAICCITCAIVTVIFVAKY